MTLTEGVTNIGEGAFAYCSKLETVTLPGSLTVVDDSAFYRCGTGLTFTVVKGSWAENYCRNNKYSYRYR